ncbi:glycosyltransferase family 32 protein, partial [Bacteroides sp.]|uniref:glycosyltransferase family 32 protein n=1 Tax=Bacteroides sp. TaxID=29523 RepID=UPI003A8CAF13
MIPEIIHYCWFGGKEMPAKEKLCIESWKKYFPKYKFIKWNEENFDLNSSTFCKQAYDMKKYAFVSDYVRTKVLYEYGGLYFDTDYEVLKPIDTLIKGNNNVLGWENHSNIGTAFMAFEAKHLVMKRFLEYYNTHSFIDKKGRIDNTANVSILTDILIT